MTVDARFCPRCGAGLSARPPTRCENCGYHLYVNARPTGLVIIVDGPTFLAVKRARQPRSGWWALPGGFCDGWETPAEAAVREAREELGVVVRLDYFVGMYLGDYEHQGEVLPVLDCYWRATTLSGTLTLDPSEASEATWLPLSDPPELAFATMNRAISDLDGGGSHAGDGGVSQPGGATNG